MTETILARHLAPVAYVPRGGRTARMGYFRMETPVRVRRVEASAAAAVDRPACPYGATRVEAVACAGLEWIPAVADATLLEALSGLGSGPGSYLRGTPWLPLTDLVPVVDGVPEDRARRIVWDGRPGAAAEAARFADREILMIGAWAHLRSRGPLHRFCGSRGDGVTPQEYAFPRSHIGTDPDMYVVSAQRLPAIRGAWISGTGRREDGTGRRWAASLAGRTGSDEDIRIMADALVQRTHESMDKALRRTEVAQAERPALREAWERLLPWRLRAEIGMVPPADTEAALRAAEAGLAALASARGPFGTGLPLAYMRQVAYPALAEAAAMPEGDAEALATLSPGAPR